MKHKRLIYVFAGVFVIILVTIALISPHEVYKRVFADDVTSTVIVGNSAPVISGNAAESPASVGTTPTNVGANVTFQATANDSNSEDFYLAVCTTDAVTAVNGDAPTCDVATWCVSTATSSGSQASCNYTALVGDGESNAWYAFVCDGNATSAACSTSNQGTGDSGSPFKVNHRPTFNAISNDTPKDPGADITWSTDVSTTDGDTDTSADTVKLIVCKTTGLTDDDCDGGASDRWCNSSFVANDPSCAYSIPNPTADGANASYVYIVDNHYFPATGANQGSDESYTVNNIAPVVSALTINGGSAITLDADTTTNVTLGATVVDNNACGDISTVLGYMYRSGVGYTTNCDDNGDDDDNDCYADVSCSVVGSGNTCDGASDASADYECTVATQFHADPTIAGTEYPSEDWLDTLKATDDDAATHNAEVGTGVEMNTTIGYDVTETEIDYGTLDVLDSNDPLDKTTEVVATGNVGLDEELSGVNLTSGGDNIPVGNEHYALAGSTAYSSGTALTTSAVEAELNCLKTTNSASKQTKNTWWGIYIPGGTATGTYNGTVTIVSILGETAGW